MQVHGHLAAVLDADIALERMLATLVSCHHLCADRARMEDAPPASVGRRGLPFDRWLANVLDMALAALTAPARAGLSSGQPLLPLPSTETDADPDPRA